MTETSLAAALKYIATGTFGRAAENRVMQLRINAQQLLKPAQTELESKKFKGMFKE